jgi:hypothetical protein
MKRWVRLIDYGRVHKQCITKLELTKDNKYLLSCAKDGDLKMFDLAKNFVLVKVFRFENKGSDACGWLTFK